MNESVQGGSSIQSRHLEGFGLKALVFLVVAIASCKTPNAQEPEPASPESHVTDPIVLDTITVTARKREEDIRDIPFGITVIEREELERARITENRAIARRSANVNFIDSGVRGFNRFNFRGVGDIGGGFAPDDNSVGYFVDGVPMPLLAIDGDLLDIERVEILRGPQNVLFGRNAQGGAISVTTSDPSADPQFSVSEEVGNLGQVRVSGVASGPITELVSGRLAAQYRRRDGDVPNDIGDDLREIDAGNFLGTLTADLGDNTDAKIFARYEQQNESVLLRTFIEDPEFPRVRLDIEPKQDTENLATGVTLNHRAGNVTVTSLTGFYYGAFDFLNDQSDGRLFSAQTGLPPEAFDDPSSDFATQEASEFRINQELRATGSVGDIDWLLGANAYYSNFETDFFFDLTDFFVGTFDTRIETQSYDGFGSITVPVTDRIELSGELRYTYEIEEFRGGFISEPGASPVALNDQDRSETFDFLTGRLSATVQINKDIKSYVTVARGAKAGGFSFLDTDLALIPGLSVDELETAETTTYEIGLRGSLLSDRLRFGAAAFFNDTRDEQLAAFDFATFTAGIENADTETYGVEVDLTTEPVEGLVLRGALGLLETEITDAPFETGAEVGGEVPNAPEVALSISADYTIPLDAAGLSADLAFGAEYQHVGSQIADIGNTRSLDSYDVVNLRLRLIGDGYEVFAFGENVFDETYATGAFPFGVSPAGEQVSTGGVGQPRLFGLGVKLTF